MRKKLHEMSVEEISQEIEGLIKEQLKIVKQHKIELGKLALSYPSDFPIEWFELNTRITQLENEWKWRLDEDAQKELANTLKHFRQQLDSAGRYHEMSLMAVTKDDEGNILTKERHQFRSATQANIDTDYNKVLREE